MHIFVRQEDPSSGSVYTQPDLCYTLMEIQAGFVMTQLMSVLIRKFSPIKQIEIELLSS